MGKMSVKRISKLKASNPTLVWRYLHWSGARTRDKLLVLLAFLWLLSPFDGDFLPVIGWLDDAFLSFTAWWITTNSIQDMVHDENKQLSAAAPAQQLDPKKDQ